MKDSPKLPHFSLRQRKLLHFIQNQETYMTGSELARHLGVSDRTIRSDICAINDALADFGIVICAKKRYGYSLVYQNKEQLLLLNRSAESFLTREDRVRYIVFRLCLSKLPLDLGELEDEMFISRSTLEHDLSLLCRQYVQSAPHIHFIRSKNTIFFEPDERKVRIILNRLFTDNWNYNASGNSYYQYQYLQEEIVSQITQESSRIMHDYDIQMDDINMVTLNIAIAIAYFRIRSGNSLTTPLTRDYQDSAAIRATHHLLDALEETLSCRFDALERADLCLHVSASRLLDANSLTFASVHNYFDASILALADSYILRIHELFHIDFSADEDFYITLLQYLRTLSLPVHYFNDIQSPPATVHMNLMIAFEIAYAFLPDAQSYYGETLDYIELLYLAFCISGALEHYMSHSPRLKTVILCHLNLTCTWNLKYRILSKFEKNIELLDLLPVYVKDHFDFSDIDLVITTTNKEITDTPSCKTIVISPFFTKEDADHLEQFFTNRTLQQFYALGTDTLSQLLSNAFWHEQLDSEDYTSVLRLLASDFLTNNIVSNDYLDDLLLRESILSFAFESGIAIAYSLAPATQTRLSAAILTHRVRIHGCRLRVVLLLSIRQEDTSILFGLLHRIYGEGRDFSRLSHIKSSEELISWFIQP